MTALVERRVSPAGGAQAARATRFTALVVVSSPFRRESIARTLCALGAVEVREAASLAEARARAAGASTCDLVVVDDGLPDGSGIALVRELRGLGWSRGLLLSASEDPYTVRAALAAGVRGFLVSASSGAARRGNPPHPVSGAQARVGRPTGAEALSCREIEVLQLVAAGRSNKEVGAALTLSALTVKSHLARIARKLGTGDRAEMVVVAMRAGVVA